MARVFHRFRHLCGTLRDNLPPLSSDKDIGDICDTSDDNLLTFGSQTDLVSLEASVDVSQPQMSLVVRCKIVMGFDK